MVLDNLKILRIYQCTRPDLFLDAITHPVVGRPVKVKTFTIAHKEAEGTNLISQGLDRFLASFVGLKQLGLRIVSQHDQPSISLITMHHGITLKRLYVSYRNSSQHPKTYQLWTTEDIRRLSEHCHRLQQLGIALHPISSILYPAIHNGPLYDEIVSLC